MCGIIGYAAHTEVLTQEALIRGRDQMAHRGPNDAGIYIDRGAQSWVGFGHRRLSIMDLSDAGHQPFQSPCGRYTLVYNGELYELPRLRALLLRYGVTLKTRCDTEILLYLLIYVGLDVLSLINGVYAFGFWDAHAQQLLLARDRFGVKPLYYAHVGGEDPLDHRYDQSSQGLIFASEVKALLATGRVDDQLNLQAHVDYLTLTYTPTPQSAIQAVAQLPPGSWIKWSSNAGVSRGEHWSPQMSPISPPPTLARATSQLRAHLCSAVEERLVSDVPVGLFLSGGVDSTALLYAAAEVSTAPLHTFTVRFNEESFDESPYARQVADYFGAIHHEETVQPTPDEFMGPLMDALDTPFADSSAIPLWYLCRSAKSKVTVILGGDGGDEIFAGYRTHQAAQLARLYRSLPTSITKLIPTLAHSLPVSHKKISLDLKLKYFTRAASAPPAEAHFGFKEFLPSNLRERLFAPLIDRLRERGQAGLISSPVRHFYPHFDPHPLDLDPHSLNTLSPFSASSLTAPHRAVPLLQQHLKCDQRLYLPDNILTKGDRVSMGHHLELRVPLLDPRLTEWVNALPPHFKLRGLSTKVILKRALSGRSPRSVTHRSKSGFNVPMSQWLLGPLKPLCRELLSTSKIKHVGLWSPQVVQEMWTKHQNKQVDYSRPLWAMLCFMIFNERFRDGREAN